MSRQISVLNLSRLYLPLLLLFCVCCAWRPLQGYDDFWAHAAVGRWIWEHQQAPFQTLNLWSAQSPWIAHSWLSQSVFYALMKIGGNNGPTLVLLWTVFFSALPFALIWRAWLRREDVPALLPLLFLTAIYCARGRFHPRPELFTALFFTLLLLALSKWHTPRADDDENLAKQGRGNASKAIFLFALFALWANFHGAVALGLLILACTLFCDLLQNGFDLRARVLAVVALGCVAAVFINPYGALLWQALKPVFGGEISTSITEWKPFWKSPALPWSVVLGEAALVMAAAGVWFGNPGRRWAHIGWLLVMSLLFLSARRHTWLLALTCLVVAASNMATVADDTAEAEASIAEASNKAAPKLNRGNASRSIPPRHASKPQATFLEGVPKMPSWAVIGCLIAALAWATPGALATKSATSASIPRGAADFILQRKPPGRLFADYENSSYFQWRFNGQPSLFIDLLNAYPDEIFQAYRDIRLATPRGRFLLDELKIDCVVLTSSRPGPSLNPLADFLDASPQWVNVYFQRDASIWMRRPAPT